MTTSRGSEKDPNAEEQAANISASTLTRPYTVFANLAGYAGYGYSLFFSAAKPEVPSPSSPCIPAREKILELYTIENLKTYKQYFADYINRNGEKPPTDSAAINRGLSYLGGYIRINQDFAKRARDAINTAEENSATNEPKEAIFVYEALKKLSEIHKEMEKQPAENSKVKGTIETILRFFQLSVSQENIRDQELEAACIQLNTPAPRARSLSSPRS